MLDPRSENADYFVASADISQGWSGAGAFDDGLALVGIVAHGGPDFFRTHDGCMMTDECSSRLPSNTVRTHTALPIGSIDTRRQPPR